MKPQIPWLRVFVEGVVIVGSILLAFGIDAWWEGVQEREEEQEILTGLRADFQQIEQELRFEIDRGDEIVVSIEFLLTHTEKPASEIPVAAVDSTLRRLIQAPSYEPGQASLAALLGSGRLDLLRSRALQDALSTWRFELGRLVTSQVVVRDFIRESLVPYLAEEDVPLLRAYQFGLAGNARGEVRNRPQSVVSEASTALVYENVLSADEFRSLVAYRHSWGVLAVGQMTDLLTLARQILDLIAVEMREES